ADSLVTAGTSPLLATVAIAVPIETAGKRGYRIARAERLTEAARLELADVAWRVRSQVRATLAEHLFARRELELLEAEEAIRAESVAVMEKRLAAGDVSRPEVDVAQAELGSNDLAAREAPAPRAGCSAARGSAPGWPR